MFNIDFGRPIWWQGHQKWDGKSTLSVPLLKVGGNLPSLPYSFRGPWRRVPKARSGERRIWTQNELAISSDANGTSNWRYDVSFNAVCRVWGPKTRAQEPTANFLVVRRSAAAVLWAAVDRLHLIIDKLYAHSLLVHDDVLSVKTSKQRLISRP